MVAVRKHLVAGREASAVQSLEHPLGRTQDAWKQGEPRQQPRWRLCSGEVLMTYQLLMKEKCDVKAIVTLQMAVSLNRSLDDATRE